MKKLTLLLSIFVCACGSESNTNSTESQTTAEAQSALELKNACDFISAADVTEMFNIQTEGMETYAKTPSPNQTTCQYIWQGTASPSSGHQLMITITMNDEKAEMPRRFSNMLRIHLQDGMMGVKQENIKPSPVEGLGEFAYHWAQLSFQNTQKICFQKDENYLVEVMYNANEAVDNESIKSKLLEISNTLQTKL